MEVLMVQRTKKADFAGGALLFPGGKVDNSDYEVLKLDRCSLPNDVPDNQKALRVAGVREMFEEAGLLFVRGSGDTHVISKERAEVLKNIYRQDLLSQKITFHEIVEAEDLVVASDLLIPFAHWITPITGRKRFDTHFLVAQSPDGHIASHDGSETGSDEFTFKAIDSGLNGDLVIRDGIWTSEIIHNGLEYGIIDFNVHMNDIWSSVNPWPA